LSQPQGHSAAGRIRSIEKSNNLIGIRSHYLPAYSTVPEPTTLPSATPPPILPSIYINDTPRASGVLGLLVDDTCVYATDRKEGYVLRKLQRGLNVVEIWCERWNIKINEDRTQAP
jgi:hypothetical protein